MAIRGQWGLGRETPCSYLHEPQARMELMWLSSIDAPEFEALMAQGYRHFGMQFFRPLCRQCHACVPLRVLTAGFRYSRSARRTLARAAGLSVEITAPQPSAAAHELYCRHKERFRDTNPDAEPVTYDEFVASFYHPYPFSYTLNLRDGPRLIAVAHFDMTARLLSAVYCYYDPADLAVSPGRLAVYHQIALARERQIPYVYLGYYIAANRHMRYKAGYSPSEVLVGADEWVPFMDARAGCLLAPERLRRGFQPPGKPRLA